MREYFFWALIAGLVPFVLKRPLWGGMAYIVLNIIRPEMLFWGGHIGSLSLKIIIGATMAATMIKLSEIDIKKLLSRELILLLWLFAGLKLSILFSDYYIERADYYAFEIFKLLVLCVFITLAVNKVKDALMLQRGILVAVTLLGIWGIEQALRGNTRLEGLGGSSFGDSNSVAALFVLYFPLAFVHFVESRETRTKLMYGLSSMVIVLLIMFTKSRGGFLALVASVCYCVYQAPSKKTYMTWVMIGLLCALPFAGEQYMKRINTLKVSSVEDMEGSGRSRLYLWSAGLHVFMDNPFLGTGFMTYPLAKMKYEHKYYHLDAKFREWVFRKESPKVTHNTYIQMMSDTGIVGVFPYLWLIFGVFVSNRRLYRGISAKEDEDKGALRMLRAMEAGIAGFCVSIIFIDSITFIFFPIQIVASACLRDCLVKKTLYLQAEGAA